MRRTWIVIACLAACLGCGPARKSLRSDGEVKPAATVREAPARDSRAEAPAVRQM